MKKISANILDFDLSRTENLRLPDSTAFPTGLDENNVGAVFFHTSGKRAWIWDGSQWNEMRGPKGRGIDSARSNGDGTFTITYDDGTTFTSEDLTGPRGATGPKGEKGDTGEKGDPGDPGADGVQETSGNWNLPATFTLYPASASDVVTPPADGTETIQWVRHGDLVWVSWIFSVNLSSSDKSWAVQATVDNIPDLVAGEGALAVDAYYPYSDVGGTANPIGSADSFSPMISAQARVTINQKLRVQVSYQDFSQNTLSTGDVDVRVTGVFRTSDILM